MSGYRLEIRPSVERTLRKIRDQKLQQRIDRAFDQLRRTGAEKMAAYENRYRFRIGDYRVIYEIHDSALLVLILAVGGRKEIYR